MPSPPTSRSRPPLAVIAATVLVVVALIALLTTQILGGGSAATPDKPKPKADPTSSSSCNLPDGDQTIPTKGPAAEWVLVAGAAEPRSEKFGPGRRERGIGACFAHNPAGVLFAAANLSTDLTDPAVNPRDLTRLRVVHSAGYTKLLRETSATSGGSAGGTQIAGYRFVSYDPNTAALEIAWKVVEGPKQGALLALTYDMRWSSGDWRLFVDESGMPAATSPSTLNGYVRWSGVSS